MKILLVGDLRTAYNYGAIATTEALIDMVQSVNCKNEIKMIDRRSFFGTTPVEGWPEFIPPIRNKGLRKALKDVTKKLHVYNIVKRIVKKNFSNTTKGNSPARYDEYSTFASKVLNGATWQYERKLLEWADIVLVNSEGNIVNGTDTDGYYRYGGRYVLFFEYLSKVWFEKPTYVINHTVDPQNRDIKKIISEIYPKLDGVYVRERKSIKVLNDIGVNNAVYVPDALWSHDFTHDSAVTKPTILNDFDFSEPYICVGDSSGVANNYSHVKWNVVEVFTKLIDGLQKEICSNIIFIDGYGGNNDEINKIIRENNLAYVNLNNCNYHELYYVLSHAQLFISGRWHASILALMGHTPVLLWGSDSHKTEALYEEIEYPYEFFDVSALPLNIDRIVKEANTVITENHDKQWKIVNQLGKDALNNIDML